MSESAPERANARSGGNVFTHKIGPLPMIVWVMIIGGVIVAWSLFKSRTSGSSSAASQDTGTSAADVPQFVNQTYTTVTPPSVTINEPPETEPGAPPPRGGGDKGGPPVPSNYHPPHPKPPVPRPGPAHQPPIFNAVYIVRKGDTLNSVAKKYGVTRVELAHANGYGTGAGLRTGERLHVPQPAGTGTPNKAP
jgi:LysM repeat protein